jgi:hypothetical protein
MSNAEQHEKFAKWVVKRGVKVHPHIKACDIPGKGYGIVATGTLKVTYHYVLSGLNKSSYIARKEMF